MTQQIQKIPQPTPASLPAFQMSNTTTPNSGLTMDANQPSQFPQPGQQTSTPQPSSTPTPAQQNGSTQNPPANPQDQATIAKWRAAGLSDQQISTGLMRKKQMEAAGGYNADGTPSNPNPSQSTDPFGGRSEQQVLALAFQSGITDAASLKNIQQVYQLVTNGGQTDQTAAATADASTKMTLGALMSKYGQTMSPDAIIKIYNDHSPWGQASSQSIQALKAQGYNITTDTTSAVNQDLKDAQSAIDQGADPTAVKKRFLQIHPESGSAFNNYVQ